MLVSALAASQPPLSTQSSYGELLLVSLGLVAVVAVVGYVVARSFRGMGRRGGGLLEIIARQPLEPRRSLYVVRVAGRTLLLGTSEMGLTMLTELEGVEEAEAARPTSFADLVRDAAVRWKARRDGAASLVRDPERGDPGPRASQPSEIRTGGPTASGAGNAAADAPRPEGP